MAILYISEYSRLGGDADGHIVAVGFEPATEQTPVTFTTSTASAAFGADTKFIRVQADAGCFIAFGAAPTATTSSKPLTADTPEYFGVIGGQKVAAYDGTS